MKKDIENRSDIELLVNIFYEKLVTDKRLGFIFRQIAKVNGSTYLDSIYNFCENIILFTGPYEGNLVNLHRQLHLTAILDETHFDHWNQLFVCTIDKLFEGKKADLAKQRAISISGIIKQRIFRYQQGANKIY